MLNPKNRGSKFVWPDTFLSMSEGLVYTQICLALTKPLTDRRKEQVKARCREIASTLYVRMNYTLLERKDKS